MRRFLYGVVCSLVLVCAPVQAMQQEELKPDSLEPLFYDNVTEIASFLEDRDLLSLAVCSKSFSLILKKKLENGSQLTRFNGKPWFAFLLYSAVGEEKNKQFIDRLLEINHSIEEKVRKAASLSELIVSFKKAFLLAVEINAGEVVRKRLREAFGAVNEQFQTAVRNVAGRGDFSRIKRLTKEVTICPYNEVWSNKKRCTRGWEFHDRYFVFDENFPGKKSLYWIVSHSLPNALRFILRVCREDIRIKDLSSHGKGIVGWIFRSEKLDLNSLKIMVAELEIPEYLSDHNGDRRTHWFRFSGGGDERYPYCSLDSCCYNAIERDDFEMVQYLLTDNRVNGRVSYGQRLAVVCYGKNNPDLSMLKLFLENTDFSQDDLLRKTFTKACYTNNLEKANLLLECKKDDFPEEFLREQMRKFNNNEEVVQLICKHLAT